MTVDDFTHLFSGHHTIVTGAVLGAITGLLSTVPEVGETAIIMCDWLDKPGPIRFSMRSESQRLEIVDLISTAPSNTMEGWFYSNMRLLAIEFFYAKPEALVGLELSAAPQPEGYLPPWE